MTTGPVWGISTYINVFLNNIISWVELSQILSEKKNEVLDEIMKFMAK